MLARSANSATGRNVGEMLVQEHRFRKRHFQHERAAPDQVVPLGGGDVVRIDFLQDFDIGIQRLVFRIGQRPGEAFVAVAAGNIEVSAGQGRAIASEAASPLMAPAHALELRSTRPP